MQNSVLTRALSRVLFSVAPGGPRHRALKDLRTWESRRQKLRKIRKEAVTGGLAAARAKAGNLRPYRLRCKAEAVLVAKSGRRVAELVGWVVGAEKAFRRSGVRWKHGCAAKLLGCSPRTAGAAMRRAVADGWLVRTPWFVAGATTHGVKHDQRECLYQLSDQFSALQSAAENRALTTPLLVGKFCQPTNIQDTTYPKKVSAGGTADSVRRPQAVDKCQPAETPPRADRPPPQKAPDRVVRRLETATVADQDLAAVLGRAWAAFDRTH